MPTYVELIEMSNGDLTKCIRIASEAVDKARYECQLITEKEQIYLAYDNERLKRLAVAKRN